MMRTSLKYLVVPTLAWALLGAAGPYRLNYGGRVFDADTGAPLSGAYDLAVSFFSEATGGEPLAGIVLEFPETTFVSGSFELEIALDGGTVQQIFTSAEAPVYIEVKDRTRGVTFPRQRYALVPVAAKVPVDADALRFDETGKLTLARPLPETPAGGGLLQADANGNLTWGASLDAAALTTGTIAPARLPALGGATSTVAGTAGVVAAPPAGSQTAFLRGDGTWSTMPFFTSGGNVGIGTTTPAHPLTVGVGTPAVVQSQIAAISPVAAYVTTLWTVGGIETFMGGDGSGYGMVGTFSDHDLVIRTNNVEKLRVVKDGKVGIGTSTPGSRLDVVEASAGDPVVTFRNTSAGGFSAADFLDSSGTLRLGIGYGNGATGDAFQGRAYVDAVTGSDVVIAHNRAPSATFKSSGNVGIGTTTPNDKLELYGNNGAYLRVTTDDVVNAAAGVAVHGNGAPVGYLYYGATGSRGGWLHLESTAFVSGGISFDTFGYNKRMVITSAGDVGIATTTPGARFEVNGNVKITGGNPATGRVLTSDADGLASWQAPSGGTMRHVAAYGTAVSAQSLANATPTAVSFPSEHLDTSTLHDNVTNNSRVTVNVGGAYNICWNVTFAANGTGARMTYLLVNGTSSLGGQSDSVAGSAAADVTSKLCVLRYLSATEYVEVMAQQTSGGALDITSRSLNLSLLPGY